SVRTNLDVDAWIYQEVAVPVGMGRSAALRRDDDEMLPVTGIGQRIGPLPTGFRAARRKQKQRTTGEWTLGDLTVMLAEIFDDPFVEPRARPRAHPLSHIPVNNFSGWAFLDRRRTWFGASTPPSTSASTPQHRETSAVVSAFGGEPV